MSFIEQVNSIKDGVLKRPEYSTAIKTIFDRANEYTASKKLEEKLNERDIDEPTL